MLLVRGAAAERGRSVLLNNDSSTPVHWFAPKRRENKRGVGENGLGSRRGDKRRSRNQRYRHQELLEWSLKHNYSRVETNTGCAGAAESGQLEALKPLMAHDCPWDCPTPSDARESGHMEVVQWAQQNGCPEETPNDTFGVGKVGV